ncbi:hypothetical protein GOBAR_AA03914 [Gossypium barbadense]|uniref:1-phosphatidylinositol-4-phosphate 5-kinase n=1 Tax=Gossypium barbadense TaxID=3634 RepID=A0A2P5YM56_GOSBA|nr:hypothetical protein GOBAR_AA03914 [Gossypium barbadense]
MSKEHSGVLRAWESTMRKTQAAKKRANNIFGITSMANVTNNDLEDDTDKGVSISGEAYFAEKILPNGDYYTGQWYDNFPDGQGKYLWTDGCMYLGEWHKGKTMGKGRFSWPSGASYEGEFKAGYMDGSGTYIGSNGETYKGKWVMNMKHGHGILNYSNGDCYDGEWRRGFQEGHGKGQMSVDGRVSVGVERPLDKMSLWENDGNSNGLRQVRRDLDCELLGIPHNDANPKFNLGLPLKAPKLEKRQGETISKGHRNYELMLNLQLGIRHSVGRPAPATSFDLKASAFDPKDKIWTRFPREGSKYTPPHQSYEFKWKDYCPVVFRTLRKLFKVDPADYMISICGDNALRELSSPGKSGSFFYLTDDDRYMIKTMKKSEVKMFLRMLSAYYNHVRSFENTLVIKYYGLHCVKIPGTTQKKVRFIIMGNLLRSDYTIHRRFDLKGSSLGRITEKNEFETDNTTILKDLDLNFIFKLQKAWYQEFCW